MHACNCLLTRRNGRRQFSRVGSYSTFDSSSVLIENGVNSCAAVAALTVEDLPALGLKTHNQRVERLWLDLCVTSLFYQLLYFLVETSTLDPLKDLDLYALHYVYIPRINQHHFQNAWNNSRVRTTGLTPLQMFIRHARNLHSTDLLSSNWWH